MLNMTKKEFLKLHKDKNGNKKSTKRHTFEVTHRSQPAQKMRIKKALAGYGTVDNLIAEMKHAEGFISVRYIG